MSAIDNLEIEDHDDLKALLDKLNPQTYADVLFTRTLAEGIAAWGATEVYGERESAEQGEQFDSPFAHEQYILSEVVRLPKFLQPLDMMKSVPLHAISEYNRIKKTKTGYLEFGSSQLLFSKIYTVLGHATVNDIMQILLRNNVSRKDAINSIILNPPQSFDELFKAESYCQRLLGTENGL